LRKDIRNKQITIKAWYILRQPKIIKGEEKKEKRAKIGMFRILEILRFDCIY